MIIYSKFLFVINCILNKNFYSEIYVKNACKIIRFFVDKKNESVIIFRGDFMNTDSNAKTFIRGMKNAIPVGLAYIAVSFAIGVSAVGMGLNGFITVLMAMTNMASAGQQAGVLLILAMSTVIELIVTQLVVNARYFLMSLSLSQRLDPKITLLERCLIACGVTDEVFAVSVSNNKGHIDKWYIFGVEITAWVSWSFGTLLGVIVGDVLPEILVNALSIGIFAMFISIVFTAVFADVKVLPVITLSAALSCVIYYVPQFESLNNISCVICGLIASIFGALVFPIKDNEDFKDCDDSTKPCSDGDNLLEVSNNSPQFNQSPNSYDTEAQNGR